MLSLYSETPVEWVERIEEHLEEVLIDHAHCEKKAAGTAMNLIFSYVEHVEFVTPLSLIVEEELLHFRQVLEILERRGIRFRKQDPSGYGRKLVELARREEPGKIVDRCLIAGLIEARSCERFAVLRDHLKDRELAEFYGTLFESEARHHSTYVQFAKQFAPEEEVRARLHELSKQEAAIVAERDPWVRLHNS